MAGLALVGAVLSCRSDDRRLRCGALIVLGAMGVGIALWISLAFVASLPLPPVYMEIGFWPPLSGLYGAGGRPRPGRCFKAVVPIPDFRAAALAVMLLAAFGLGSVASPVDGQWPSPPSRSPIVDTLAARTAILNGAPFEGVRYLVVPATLGKSGKTL